MSMLDYIPRRSSPKLDMESIGVPEIEENIADLAKTIQARRAAGDRALADANRPPQITLPPTASNVFATNAIDLMQKREALLNEAIMLASDLEQLAGEMIACGTRVQDFMKRAQDLTSAIVETKPQLALVRQEQNNDVQSPDGNADHAGMAAADVPPRG